MRELVGLSTWVSCFWIQFCLKNISFGMNQNNIFGAERHFNEKKEQNSNMTRGIWGEVHKRGETYNLQMHRYIKNIFANTSLWLLLCTILLYLLCIPWLLNTNKTWYFGAYQKTKKDIPLSNMLISKVYRTIVGKKRNDWSMSVVIYFRTFGYMIYSKTTISGLFP